ncbi:subtilisin-like protein [Lactarius hengduanensis]|nr:subtilisin-like protein [Lactarius hengduanensis]
MRYRWLSVLFVLTVASLTALATPLAQPWHDISVKHAWETVPHNWECLGPPPTGITIDLHVALQPKEENVLMEALYESSSISTSHGGGWLTVTDVPVPQANELLGASYQLYRLAGTNDTAIVRTIGYALPKVLHAHVNTVAPTTFFASARSLQLTPHGHSARAAGAPGKAASRGPVSVVSSRDEDITPEELRRLYYTYVYKPTALAQNAIGILGFNNEFPSLTDLDTFMSEFRADSDPNQVAFTVELVNGGQYDPSMPGVEASLNMQYAQAMSYPTPHIFYSIGGRLLWSLGDNQPIPGDLFLMWMVHLVPQEKIPQTMSISYGVNEKDVPAEYARSVCDIFMQLGVRGVSILFSSGDDGVGVGNCQDASGRVRFIPKFPATCPYITSVGGTTSSIPEVAAPLSGGGFSNYFGRPPYQNDVVPGFLRNLGNQYNGMYNPSGRGVPDVSAQALNFVIVVDTNAYRVSGTSCATPTMAGVIAMLNDFLISEGQSPLGFLNPWFYTRNEGMFGLMDIKSGSNPGCGTNGFTAISGWDPVTGLGTPDFHELMHVLFRTRIGIGSGDQRRTFSDLFNKSDLAATRDAKGIDDYFLINSSTRSTPAYKHD